VKFLELGRMQEGIGIKNVIPRGETGIQNFIKELEE
jgi:hypothetical protein